MSVKEKHIRLSYDNGAVYGIPLRVIADDRAKYYAKRDKDTTYQEEFDYVMKDDYEAIDWLGNNMDLIDLADEMFEICPPTPFDPLEEDPVSIRISNGEK